ncbi:MAG: alkaline phosphatase family protein [Candidatus Heimdallarchaeota archaeon]|nr:alkaline phosphatase family protein [Candidatus Heimdallarchaeota archaeon]
MTKKKLNVILLWFTIIFTIQLAVGLKTLNAQFELNNPLDIKDEIEDIDLIDNPLRITDQILFLFVDGMRYDKMLEANTPNIDRLLLNGTSFSNYRSVIPSYSTVNYAAFASGSSPNFTEVYSNGYNGNPAFQTLFSLIDSNDLNKSLITGGNTWIKFFGAYSDLTVKVNVEGHHTLKEGIEIMNAVYATIPGNFSKIQFIGFEDVDAAGHEFGASSSVYLETIETIDTYIGEIIDLYDSIGQLENTTIILFSDHGHADVGGHGANDIDQTHGTLIMSGKGISFENIIVSERVCINSITPTVLSMLGIPLAPLMNGKILYDYITTTQQQNALYAIQSAEIMLQQANASLNKIKAFSKATRQSYLNKIEFIQTNISIAKNNYLLANHFTAYNDAQETTSIIRKLLSSMIFQFDAVKRLSRTILIIGLASFCSVLIFFLHQRKIIEISHQKIMTRELLLPEITTTIVAFIIGVIIFASYNAGFSATDFNSVKQTVPPIMITFGLQVFTLMFLPWLLIFLLKRKKDSKKKKFKEWRLLFMRGSIGAIFFSSLPIFGYIIYVITAFEPWPNWYFPPINDVYALMVIGILGCVFILIAIIQQIILISLDFRIRKQSIS